MGYKNNQLCVLEDSGRSQAEASHDSHLALTV